MFLGMSTLLAFTMCVLNISMQCVPVNAFFHIVGFYITGGIWIPAVMDITGVTLPFKNRNTIIISVIF